MINIAIRAFSSVLVLHLSFAVAITAKADDHTGYKSEKSEVTGRAQHVREAPGRIEWHDADCGYGKGSERGSTASEGHANSSMRERFSHDSIHDPFDAHSKSGNIKNNQEAERLYKETQFLSEKAKSIGNQTTAYIAETQNLSEKIQTLSQNLDGVLNGTIDFNSTNLSEQNSNFGNYLKNSLIGISESGYQELVKAKTIPSIEPTDVPVTLSENMPEAIRQNYNNLYQQYEKAEVEGPQAEIAKSIGLSSLKHAGRAYEANNIQVGHAYFEIAKNLLDIALGILPIIGTTKDLYEFISGKSLISGEALDSTQRALTALSIFSLGTLSIIKNGEKFLSAAKNLSLELFGIKSAHLEHVTEQVMDLLSKLDDVKIFSAEELNIKQTLENLFEKSWFEKTMVIEGTITTKPQYNPIRVHPKGSPRGKWLSFEKPKNIHLQKYANNYSAPLNNLEEISSVDIPISTRLRIGIAAPNKWGSGGGVQLEIIDDTQDFWFTKIGEINGR